MKQSPKNSVYKKYIWRDIPYNQTQHESKNHLIKILVSEDFNIKRYKKIFVRNNKIVGVIVAK